MKWILFIIILAPCYALETIICDYATGSYDCAVYSPDEPLLEDVIHYYESEGMNTDITQDYSENQEDTARNQHFYTPMIFPFPPRW